MQYCEKGCKSDLWTAPILTIIMYCLGSLFNMFVWILNIQYVCMEYKCVQLDSLTRLKFPSLESVQFYAITLQVIGAPQMSLQNSFST